MHYVYTGTKMATHVCPFCSSANLEPTESIQPCAASPRFVRPSPIALSEFMPGIDAGVTGPMLARLPELELGPEPVLVLAPINGLSVSANGTRASRERRRNALLDGDGSWSDDVRASLCGATNAGSGLDVGVVVVSWAVGSSREAAFSAFPSATEDMDDCERRGLAPGLVAEVDVVDVGVVVVVVVVEETEFDVA
jgi:hypothetical protein